MRLAFVLPMGKGLLGSYQMTIEIIKQLAQQDEITVFSDSSLDLNEVKVERVPCLPYPSLIYFLSFFISSCFKRIFQKRNFDLIFSSGADVLNADIVIAHLCQRARGKAIQTFALLPKNFLNLVRNAHFLVYLKFTEFFERRALAQARKVITVSEKVSREIRDLYCIDPKKISVIPNGIDLERFHPRNREANHWLIRSRLNVRSDDFLILFAGSDWRHKGLETLIRALALVEDPSIKLLVVGEGKFDLSVFSKFAKKLGLGKQLFFESFSSEIEQYYAAADLFVYPTFYDSFALVVLEAMASALPVIVSREAGITDYLCEGKDAVFLKDPSDARELVRKVKELKGNQSFLKQLSEEARKTAERFSREETVNKVVALIQEVGSHLKKS